MKIEDRPIKFRAWDGKIMSPVFSLHNDNTCIIQNGVRRYYSGGFKNCTIMQYTGIKDNNGKMIFEGDIDIRGGVVTWCGNANEGLGMNVGFYIQWRDFESWEELESRDNRSNDNYEIIGNIFENPELVRR